MDHVAIMKKGVGSIEDILLGIKGIESRWSKRKISPYDKICEGDMVYFKYSADKDIIATARVREVMQFELTEDTIKEIVERYGGQGGINLRNRNPTNPYFIDKKYCVLIFLEDARAVKPFRISRRGYGTAWFCVGNIDSVRVAA